MPRLNPSTTQPQPQPLQSHLHTACNVTHPHATSTPVRPHSLLARATLLPRTVAPPRPPVAVPHLNPSATQLQPQPPQLHWRTAYGVTHPPTTPAPVRPHSLLARAAPRSRSIAPPQPPVASWPRLRPITSTSHP